MAEVIIFVITTLILGAFIMLIPKNVARQNAVVWLVATCLTVICSWVLFAGVINLMKIKVNLNSLSVMNISLSIFSAMYIAKKKKIQKYFVDWKDILALTVLAILAVMMGFRRYGMGLDVFAYAADDSARHFNYTRELAKTGCITRERYVMCLIDMVFIKCLDPFIGFLNWYRAFLLGDIFLWFMMGAMFWTGIRRFVTGKYSLFMGYGFTLMYFFGYPLMNMLYGFEYLGAGVLMINFLLWIIQKIDFHELPEWLCVFLLMIANTAVCLSYTQFAPVAFAGEILYFVLYFKKKKRFFSVYALATLLLGFAVPGVLCVSYVAPRYLEKILPIVLLAIAVLAVLVVAVVFILWFQARNAKKKISEVWKLSVEKLGNKKWLCRLFLCIGVIVAVYVGYRYVFQGIIVQFTTKDMEMLLEGSIYREPYANFLILLFPMILYVVDCIKKKQNDVILWMSACTVIFSGWLIYCILQGSIGSYYFYKMHFLFWLFLFVCAFKKVVSAEGEVRKILTTYLISVMALFFIFLTGGEQSLIERNNWLWEDNVSGKLFGVYGQNMEMIESGGNVNLEMQTIYNVVAEIVAREDTFIPYFGEELRYLREYYYHLTNQDPYMHPDDLNSKDYPSFDIREDLEERNILYLFVEKDYNGPYEEYKLAFDVMWEEFENDYGWILKLD